MEKLYTAKATAVGGREGRVKSEDGVLDFKVEVPKEMGGKGGDYTNPEQLFAAGYAACFDSALNLIAKKSEYNVESTEITTAVSIGSNGKGGFDLAVDIEADIQGVSREEAQELLEKAHQVCPYSNATRGNIEVNLNLK